MISVSNEYKDNLNNKALSPKSKIIVDGVVYLGNVIKTFPKIKHQATDVIGCFPAKTVSFEIYDYNNELDFINKEVEVYQGFMINGIPVYVKQGIFIPKDENVKTNISNKVISFENVQDRTQLLEDKYESNLDWSNNQTHTGLEIVQEICTRKQITLKTSNFSFANYQFKQPNFPENITDRQVIARLSEIGGENAYFDYDGKLVIKGQTNTNDTLQRSRYEKISVEKTITYNTVVLGKKDVNDDIVYPSTIAVDRVERRIEDNPFVDLIREEIIENVAQHIIGLTYTPYELQGCVDGHIYELNDVISVIDRNGNTVRAVVLDFENSSRIKSKIKLSLDSKNTTNYNLAGSNKESLDKIRLDVDHINDEIDALVDTTDSIQKEINPTDTSSGSSIYLEDSAESELIDFELEGKTTQETRSGKNLLNINEENPIESKIASAIISGSKITLVKDTSSTANTTRYVIPITLEENTDYIITGKAKISNNSSSSPSSILLRQTSAGGTVIKRVELDASSTDEQTISATFNSGSYTNVYFWFYVNSAQDTTSTRTVEYIDFMVRKVDTTPDYEQYGVSPSPDYPSELVSVGYENLLNNTATSQTINGLNIVVNNDKTVSISGTATATTDLTIVTSMILKAGTYTLSGTPSTGGSSTYKMQLLRAGSTQNEVGNGLTFTTTEDYNNVGLIIKVYSGQTLNNITFKPQLEKGNQTHSYIPYGKYGIEVGVIGKNLFNKDNYLSGYFEGNESTIIASSNRNAVFYIKTDKNTNYNLHLSSYNNLSQIRVGSTDTLPNSGVIVYNVKVFNYTNKNLIYNTGNYNYIVIRIQTNAGYTITPNNINDIITEFQVEKGNVFTDYEEYKSNTYLYTLDQPLRSNIDGTIKDLLYIKNGMLYVDRYIRHLNLAIADMNNGEDYPGWNNQTQLKNDYPDLNTSFSSANIPYQSNIGNQRQRYSLNTRGTGVLWFPKNQWNDMTQTDWKTSYPDLVFDFNYALSEPYTEELGTIQIPSTYEGITYLNTTDELEPNMNITYVRDTLIANYVESHVSELKITEKGIESRVQTIEDSDYGGRIDTVELNQTSTDLIVDVISTKSGINLDYDSEGKPISGKVTEVTTINGMTFNKDGLNIHTNQSTFNAQHTYDGTYYRDGEEVITETTINGFKATNLKNKGQHEYSYDDINDLYEFIDERVEVDGKYCYATFYNGEE